jgi:hypothetical protein
VTAAPKNMRLGPLVGKGFTQRERRIARFVERVCTEEYGYTPGRLLCAMLVRKYSPNCKCYDEELACRIAEREEVALRASVSREISS